MSAHQQYPPLQYGSVCSGIEVATAAWHSLGMTVILASGIASVQQKT